MRKDIQTIAKNDVPYTIVNNSSRNFEQKLISDDSIMFNDKKKYNEVSLAGFGWVIVLDDVK